MILNTLVCDGCNSTATFLYAHSNGRGERVDLCEHCLRRIVLRCLKSGLWVPRVLCDKCGGRGVVPYRGTMVECPHCCH